jgi:hypothetical protein
MRNSHAGFKRKGRGDAFCQRMPCATLAQNQHDQSSAGGEIRFGTEGKEGNRS